MAFGPDKKLYFTDYTVWHLYRLNSNGSLTVLTPRHLDGSGRGAYYWPWSLAFGPGGDLYFSQFSMGAVRRLSPIGAVTNVAGVTQRQGDGGPATSAQLFRPADVAFDSLGNMFIADSSNAVIRRVSTAGIIETIAGTGERLNLATKGASARETPIGFVSHLAAHMDTIYFVTQSDIWSISPGGEIAAIAHLERENDVQPPMGDVHTAADGKVYFSDIYKNTIWCIQKRESSPLIVAGRGGRGYRGDGSAAINAALSGPMALTTDPYGNLYFLDYHNRRIRRVSASGVISTIAGNGEKSAEFIDGEWALEVPLHDPQRLAWGPDDALYLSDGRGIRRIFMADVKSESRQDRGVGPGAAIATVAGGSIAGFSGDGGPARMARLDTPTGMAFGPDGNLYFADTGNNRIRVLRRGGPTPRPAQ
jgi:sugar lactone lactonase YvrE